MPIRDVSIAGVRGINGLVRFDLRGRSLLLHGDNGTGKSSFERALRWALRGDEEPTSDAPFTTAESFRRHVRAESEQPSVCVTFSDGSTISVRPGELVTTGQGEAIREACFAGQPFLRRSELLTVLGARPADRFAYFETFLGLQRVDKLIEELGARRSATQARASAQGAKLAAALEPLRSLLPTDLADSKTLPDVIRSGDAWARKLALSGASAEDKVRELRSRIDALATGDANALPYRLSEADRSIQTARALFESLLSKMSDLLQREHAASTTLTDSTDVELLNHALAHFRRSEGSVCPLCKQTVAWSQTREMLESRVAALTEYSSVRGELLQVTRKLKDAASVAQAALSEAASIASRLGVNVHPFASPRELATVLSADEAALQAYFRSAKMSEVTIAITSACDAAVQEIVRLTRLIPDTNDLPDLRTAVAFYDRFGQVRPSAELLHSEVEALLRESASLNDIVEALRRSRQDVAKETLTKIEGLVSDYYFKIHPAGSSSDVTGAPSIEVQRHGRGTAFVRGEFGGQQIRDPTWVYSDGHLDTVGLCIFLALRRFRSAQSGDPKIMVLDDVVISIDLGHSRRLLELLKNEFGDHQVLILTHNGLFAYWCKSLLPGLTRLQIKGWTLDGGPKIGDYASARERVEFALQNGTEKEIAVSLMELLDEWTADARYEYEVAVPAKPGEQYTLSEIWDPLSKRLRTIARSLNSDLGGAVALLESLRDVPQVRNALAGHHNAFAQEFPRTVIARIADDACRLIDTLYCRECGAFVVPVGDRSNPSVMECPNHHKQFIATAR